MDASVRACNVTRANSWRDPGATSRQQGPLLHFNARLLLGRLLGARGVLAGLLVAVDRRKAALPLGFHTAANQLPDLVDEADADESEEGLQDALERQRGRLKGGLHEGDVNGCQTKQDLTDKHNVEGHVWEAIRLAEKAKHALHLCGAADGCGNLAHHEGPVVDTAALGVGVDILLGVLPLVLSYEAGDVGSGPEEHQPAEKHLDLADKPVAVEEDLPIHELLVMRVAGLPLHKLGLGRLQGIGDRRPDVCADVDEQNLLHRQRWREACDLAEGGRHLGNLGAQRVHDGLLQVLARQAPLLNAIND
mmetsp:Transcript_18775/g.50990  ORF Transcript_18775/g.50990 Transcript_18775/m.50990 type:complete len:306 (-) Transcript_18775:65-982(-)